jgi:hypothetical protein
MHLRLIPWLTLLLAATTACTPSQLESLPEPVEGPEGISPEVWAHALAAHQRATDLGLTTRQRIVIIDYTRASSERRLWVVETGTHEVLMHEYVAHAINSGGTYPYAFSNRDGSNQSSLGVFITGRPYIGIRGLALRLEGREPGINDRAASRGIVFHGTPNVSEARALKGSMGRTQGCPAVPMKSIRGLIKLVRDGVVVFAWYPDKTFLARSAFLDQTIVALGN